MFGMGWILEGRKVLTPAFVEMRAGSDPASSIDVILANPFSGHAISSAI
jgi:hypothetical protein